MIRRMIACPSYSFIWDRRKKHSRHIHAEERKKIIRLKAAVEAVYRSEWDTLPAVIGIVVHRGFVEAITAFAGQFVRTAGSLFACEPIQDVQFYGLSVFYQTGGT